jgi:hypothetical protein
VVERDQGFDATEYGKKLTGKAGARIRTWMR